MLKSAIDSVLNELLNILSQLTNEQYSKPQPQLSGASIGAHVRHILELFVCLEHQYQAAEINYELRARDLSVQTDRTVAAGVIQSLFKELDKPNKALMLTQSFDQGILKMKTNYHRELAYNLEHCVHHQALIRVALLSMPEVVFEDHFGVARATIQYKKQCAQ
jgi:hypothetical protein